MGGRDTLPSSRSSDEGSPLAPFSSFLNGGPALLGDDRRAMRFLLVRFFRRMDRESGAKNRFVVEGGNLDSVEQKWEALWNRVRLCALATLSGDTLGRSEADRRFGILSRSKLNSLGPVAIAYRAKAMPEAGTKEVEAILARLYPIEQAICIYLRHTTAGIGVKARHAADVIS
jgi:hypothetical protein